MVTTSYPRFPGDSVGTFMEPIARSVAARGHEVHVVAPWHPLVARPREEHGVQFHFYRYAPLPSLNVFGYAAAMRADVSLRAAAYLAAPLALAPGWRDRAEDRPAASRDGHARPLGDARRRHRRAGGAGTAARRQPPRIGRLRRRDARARARRRPSRVSPGRVRDRVQRRPRNPGDRARRRSVPHRDDAVRCRHRAVSSGRGGPPLRAGRSWVSATACRCARPRDDSSGRRDSNISSTPLRAVPGVVLAIAGEGTLQGELAARAAAAGAIDRIRSARQPDAGSRRRATSRPLTWSACRRCATTAATSTACPTSLLEALASGTPVITTAAGGIGRGRRGRPDGAGGSRARRTRDRRRDRRTFSPIRTPRDGLAPRDGRMCRRVSAGIARPRGSRPPTIVRLPSNHGSS